MSRNIMHVLVSLGRGGIETWLVNVFRRSSNIRTKSRICLVGNQEYLQDDYYAEVTAMGIPIYHIPFSYLGVPFVNQLTKLLRETKPTVVHSHLGYLSGFVTLAGQLANTRVRIAHYHVSFPQRHKTLLRHNYIKIVRAIEAMSATKVTACSSLALESFCGQNWSRNRKRQIIYCGIDASQFEATVDRRLRTELGIPTNAFVIGHVGRFTEQKNHSFLVEIIAEIARQEEKVYFILVGDGPLRPVIEQKVSGLGLANRVVFAGLRSDIPRLMLGAMDSFVLPSFYEGLPIVGIEAQSAGLPLILSDTITPELDIVKPLIHRVSLSQSASVWADVVLAERNSKPAVPQSEALALVRKSPLNITSGIESLTRIYTDELPQI